MSGDLAVATSVGFRLAESPVWDAARRRLLWVDIPAGQVLEGRLEHGSGTATSVVVTGRHQLDSMVGAVAVSDDGALLVAAQERLVVIDTDGVRHEGPRVLPPGSGRRCNDGATDPAGRFVVGTLSLGDPTGAEELFRLEPDGKLVRLDGGLGLSNGIAWSTDGTRMFHVDSLAGCVYVRDHDPGTGAIGEREVFLRLGDGLPDGVATDSEDHLWVAVWGAGEVRRLDPAGAVVDRIEVPAPHTSSIAFAGDELDVLVVSTAAEELSAAQLRQFPGSGHLFTTRVPVPGMPTTPWRRVVPSATP
ncbi:SMP-30/gluconolactonase/LRE family protein [Nocardioides taihuensis]|uniref:SMP-30/gluconolactonase/LRE family protein n=1 Tax=Nocardioides taihuensis TaxID=1835606 RepID=A0ABW0BMM8_9ACTN